KRQQQLAEKERYARRLSHLLSALPAGIIVLDMRGCIEESNPAATELLDEPLEGELWRDIIQRAFEPGSQAGQEARLKDGRTVSISTCPRGDEPGQIILLMDVSETRLLQQALSRHQRLSAMGEMSAKLAHQIRTPLASALLYTSNMSKTKLKVSERNKFISKTLSRLQHLENVVEDMLSFSRVGELGHEIMALSDLLQELDQAMETHLEAAGCRLTIETFDSNIQLNANRDALLGVLQNLMGNAIQACGSTGEFVLSVKTVTQTRGIASIDISLSDNGPGIPQDILPEIFEPFFTTRANGTGLGLAVAKAVVENHAGSIWVESSDSNGTRFIIRLPIVKNYT
ncbi:MAG TPA: PAS domain-containing protein, partial [Gammaproteobacteria bacterium]|nr:PAS domain-containing protein [Gammaproteobacteria bacterium]